jgi:hypothetical protein
MKQAKEQQKRVENSLAVLFLQKKCMTKKPFEKPLKRLFQSVKLCYSIDEADRSSWLNFTRIYPIRTYRQNVFADQRFNVGKSASPTQRKKYLHICMATVKFT